VAGEHRYQIMKAALSRWWNCSVRMLHDDKVISSHPLTVNGHPMVDVEGHEVHIQLRQCSRCGRRETHLPNLSFTVNCLVPHEVRAEVTVK